MKRLPLVLLVWLGCSFAWTVLGTSLVARTGASSGALLREVHLLWGRPLDQSHPVARWFETRRQVERVTREVAPGRTATVEEQREVQCPVDLPLEASALDVRLDLVHRRKGLLWFPTYTVDFSGRYTFANPGEAARDVALSLPLAGESTIYDAFTVLGPDGRAIEADVSGDSARWSARFAPGERLAFTVRYRSRGTSSWTYRLTDGAGQVKDFTLSLAANTPRVDFLPGSISPTRQARGAVGWTGTWAFERLVASAPIGLVLPERMNPGPLASRITFFAPVGLLFFLFVVAIVATVRGVALHPMHWFFIGCAFFAFHLLFAYLVDHLAIAPSFAIAAATSILLVVTYARLFAGWGFALRVLGAAQAVFLVLFSFTFFWEGFTGLAITVGAVVTLAVMMQYTGRIDWERAGGAARPGA
jgi:hypothetical protein